ncbi:hypothetical protein ACQKJC_09460 [Priestia koreensis]|uniref:hypothetical protein n=1 Tax=Priestia koreensis TaxID=284581 RepID=UPI003CFE75FB
MKEMIETKSTAELDLKATPTSSPIEEYQRIASGGPLNKERIKDIGSLPKGIRYLGYFLIGSLGAMMIIGGLLNFL